MKRLDGSFSLKLLFNKEHLLPEPTIDISKIEISESGNIQLKEKRGE